MCRAPPQPMTGGRDRGFRVAGSAAPPAQTTADALLELTSLAAVPVRLLGPLDELAQEPRRHGVQLVCVVFPGRSDGPGGVMHPSHGSSGTTVGHGDLIVPGRNRGRGRQRFGARYANSSTGRTSIVPYLAPGTLAASSTASSRSLPSTR